MSETIHYKVGDFVRINPTITTSMGEYFNETRTPYLGRVVEIESIHWEEQIFSINEGIYFRTDAIEKHVTELEIEEFKKERDALEQLRKKALEEKISKLCCTSNGIKAIASDIFGQDRVSLIQHNSREFSITILFPEFTITNTPEKQHVIRDLYVKLYMTSYIDSASWDEDDIPIDIRILGRRGKLTLKEYTSGYAHSHINDGIRDWDVFCLGASQFKVVIEETKINPTEDAWTTLFLSLINYVSWESLEGGPYHKIANIKHGFTINSTEINRELDRIISGVPKNVWEIGERISLIDNHPDLYPYFDRVSRVRSVSGHSEEQYNKALEEASKKLKKETSKNPIIWNDRKIYPELVPEPLEKFEGNIEKGIVDRMCSILKDRSKDFLIKKTFNDVKGRNYEKVFGKAGISEHAHPADNKATNGQNRLFAQQNG